MRQEPIATEKGVLAMRSFVLFVELDCISGCRRPGRLSWNKAIKHLRGSANGAISLIDRGLLCLEAQSLFASIAYDPCARFPGAHSSSIMEPHWFERQYKRAALRAALPCRIPAALSWLKPLALCRFNARRVSHCTA
jgi:hypothetical protein